MISKMMKAAFLVFGALIGSAMAQERAHIIVMKDLSTFPLIEKAEFNVTFDIHNSGGADALDVKVADNWNENFEIIEGSLEKTFDKIGAGESVSHYCTLKPTTGSVFTVVGPADVEYSWTEFDEETKEDETVTATSKSSAIGRISVLGAEEYAKYNSNHSDVWSVYFTFSGIAILLPFFIWNKKSSPYHNSGKRKAL
eukprot:g5282.t1